MGDSGCLMQIEAVRIEAIKNHRTYEAHEALRAALLRKSRPYRGTFHLAFACARPLVMVKVQLKSCFGFGQDRNPSSNVAVNIWIRNDRGRLVQSPPEQCRPIYGEQEWWARDPSDLEVLKNSDEELRVHPPAFARLRPVHA